MAEAKLYHQEDCDPSLLEGQKIAVIGYVLRAMHMR